MNRANFALQNSPDLIVSSAWSASAYINAFGIEMKNRIINGDMRVDQRNEGSLLSINGANLKSVDKWKGSALTGVFSLQRVTTTPPTGFSNYLHAAVTTADAAPAGGAYYAILTNIESMLVEDFNASMTVGLSFYVRASITGNYGGSLNNVGGAVSYPFQFALVANTWTRILLSIPGQNAWSGNPQLVFDLGSGATYLSTSGAWTASGSLLGATGDTKLISTLGATFDYIMYPVQLAMCQRYYQKSFPQGTKPAQNLGTGTGEQIFISAGSAATTLRSPFIPYLVTLRAPTLPMLYSPAAASASPYDETVPGACTIGTIFYTSDRGFWLNATANASTLAGNVIGVHWTVDADL